MRQPTIQDATKIAREVLDQPIVSARRFDSGLANWVYDVTAQDGTQVVVRVARDRANCQASVYWSETLRPLGVPLPALHAHRIADSDEEFSWVILERL